MDPYQYLFKKLGVKIIRYSSKYSNDLFWNGLNIDDALPLGWTAKDIYEYYWSMFEWYEVKDVKLNQFCMILNCFPQTLSSKEEVDLILTLNGVLT